MPMPDRSPSSPGPEAERTPVAILIPHYNDVSRLLRCLDALLPQLQEGDELVVIDNGSDVSLAPVLEQFPGLRIVVETAKGAAHARNRGVAETCAPLLMFIDSDCIPATDWLAIGRTTLKRHHADLVGGRVTVFDESPPPRSGAEAFETVFAFDFQSYIETKGFSGSGNLVTRRDVFAATGPFIHGLSEDLDWCHRATAQGYRLAYDDALRVAHPTRTNWSALARKWQRTTEEAFGINGTGIVARLRWGARALAMPASVLVHAPRVLRHPELQGGQERVRALFTLARLRLARMIWMLRQTVRGR